MLKVICPMILRAFPKVGCLSRYFGEFISKILLLQVSVTCVSRLLMSEVRDTVVPDFLRTGTLLLLKKKLYINAREHWKAQDITLMLSVL